MRRAANLFIDNLIALRKALRATLGKSHRDYQKLRTVRARAADIDDALEGEPAEPTTTEVSLVA